MPAVQNACIAKKIGKEWVGVIVEDNGQPTILGARLWEELRESSRNVRLFLQRNIFEHPGGWRHFPGVCYCHPPEKTDEWGDSYGYDFRMQHELGTYQGYLGRPGGGLITSEEVNPKFLSWLYMFDEISQRLSVYVTFVWEYLEHLDTSFYLLDRGSTQGDEPDWKTLESKGNDLGKEYLKLIAKSIEEGCFLWGREHNGSHGKVRREEIYQELSVFQMLSR